MSVRTTATDARSVRYILAEFSEVVAIITFAIVFLFFAIVAENFLTPFSLSNILTLASINGIIAVGMAMAMVSGEFDLSVGSVLAVAGYVVALSINAGVPPILAILLALLVCSVLGLINGLLVVRTGIPSFIVTLGTLLAYRGIARFIGGGDFAYLDADVKPVLFNVLNGPLTWLNELSTPAANFRYSTVWFVLLVIGVTIVMVRTPFGNWLHAVGGNPGAALAQGIAVNRVKVLAFILSGFLAGLAGVTQFAERLSVDPLRGDRLELIIIAGCVIGGVQLTGGVGTIIGAASGILLLAMLQQGLVLLGAPLQMFQAIAGFIIITAVVINTYLQRK